MVSDKTIGEWVDNGVRNGGNLRLQQYKDSGEESVIFVVTPVGDQPAFIRSQVIEIIAALSKWLER